VKALASRPGALLALGLPSVHVFSGLFQVASLWPGPCNAIHLYIMCVSKDAN
jgi:hypothetical protein